jgi:hypothetical protein
VRLWWKSCEELLTGWATTMPSRAPISIGACFWGALAAVLLAVAGMMKLLETRLDSGVRVVAIQRGVGRV